MESMMIRAGFCLLVAMAVSALSQAAETIDVGSRLELMVDEYLIEKISGAALTLH